MRVIFAKANWEARELPLPEFLRRRRSEGFSATEILIPALTESPEQIRELHAAAGLELVAQIATAGATPGEQPASIRQRLSTCGRMRSFDRELSHWDRLLYV